MTAAFLHVFGMNTMERFSTSLLQQFFVSKQTKGGRIPEQDMNIIIHNQHRKRNGVEGIP
jgi:hypothetical protein